MAAMAYEGVGASTLFCLTDDTREMVDEVSARGSQALGTKHVQAKKPEQKEPVYL